MTSRSGSAQRILGDFEKRQLAESCRPKKKGDFRLLAEALGRCRTRWGGGWASDAKARIEKNVYLYLCRRTFKLKSYKNFRTWTKKS